MVIIELGYLILFLSHEISHQRFCLKSADEINCKKPFQRGITETRGCTPVGKKRRQWHPTPVLLPGKSHGWRSLVGYSPWGRYESDTTERVHFHISLSCIGEGNGNPLQCSCLENPRDRGPGGQPSMGSHNVRHDWSNLAAVSSSRGKE